MHNYKPYSHCPSSHAALCCLRMTPFKHGFSGSFECSVESGQAHTFGWQGPASTRTQNRQNRVVDQAESQAAMISNGYWDSMQAGSGTIAVMCVKDTSSNRRIGQMHVSPAAVRCIHGLVVSIVFPQRVNRDHLWIQKATICHLEHPGWLLRPALRAASVDSAVMLRVLRRGATTAASF
jgi:hypothetical protein